MSQLVQRHGAAAVVAELLKVVPARRLRAACDASWGVHHDDPEEQACLIAMGEATPVVTPQTAHYGWHPIGVRRSVQLFRLEHMALSTANAGTASQGLAGRTYNATRRCCSSWTR